MISNINLKKLFPCLVILILLPSNSLATSACNGSEMDFNIIKTIDHQPNSFTQGLEIKGTRLFESTGIYGSSSLRELNMSSGEVIREINFDEDIFSEGISILNDSIVMLTWRGQHAKIFDIDTFELIGNYNYTGEGWGLCNNGDNFIMSNGSSKLAIRNIYDFNVSSIITVKENNKEIYSLNELECVGDLVYANIWKENRIISINITSGIVQNSISLESLSHNQKDADSVLNGIAFSEQDNYFLLTGKNWEKIYFTNLTSFNESNISCNDIESDISKFKQITNYLSKNVFLSMISIVAITIFLMPGSWPAFTFLFFRTFMRQHEQLTTSGNTNEEEED
jgi:glutamine cyclotransferase